MEVLLSSKHQIEFCEIVIEKLLSKDSKSLVFFTSRSECVETSRNLLKIFSPLIDQLSSSRSPEAAQEPLTLVLPDTDAATVRVMLTLLSRGKMPFAHKEMAHLPNVLKDVTSLAKCLGLNLNISAGLDLDVNAVSQPQAPKLKVRSPEDLLEPKLYNPCGAQSMVNKDDEDLMPKRFIIDIPKDSRRGERSFSKLNEGVKERGGEIPVNRLELELELERKEMENKRTRSKQGTYERYEKDFHNVSDSQGNRIFTCLNIKCRDLIFHSCEELRRHSNVHMNSACSRCSKLCFYEHSLFEHMNVAHLKIRRPFVCSECPGDGLGRKIYASRRQLTSHLRKVHSKRINRSGYSCENMSASYLYETEDC